MSDIKDKMIFEIIHVGEYGTNLKSEFDMDLPYMTVVGNLSNVVNALQDMAAKKLNDLGFDGTNAKAVNEYLQTLTMRDILQ